MCIVAMPDRSLTCVLWPRSRYSEISSAYVHVSTPSPLPRDKLAFPVSCLCVLSSRIRSDSSSGDIQRMMSLFWKVRFLGSDNVNCWAAVHLTTCVYDLDTRCWIPLVVNNTQSNYAGVDIIQHVCVVWLYLPETQNEGSKRPCGKKILE